MFQKPVSILLKTVVSIHAIQSYHNAGIPENEKVQKLVSKWNTFRREGCNCTLKLKFSET